jgi:transposase
METTIQTTNQEATCQPGSGARLIREVNRRTYRKFSSEDKIRIVLEGFRKEIPVSDLCRRERIHVNVYYKWLKDFMEAGKARLRKDTLRDASRDEVEDLKHENERLKSLVGELTLQAHLLKKSVTG